MAKATKNEVGFYKRLVENNIFHISPVLTLEGVRYPALDPLARALKLDTMLDLLDSLTKKDLVKRSDSETILGCPSCESTVVHAKSHCTKCGSGSIHSQVIVEHNLCGFKGFKNQFKKGVDEVCPKCDKLVRTEDVRILGSLFVCDRCRSRFDEPKLSYTCASCETGFEIKQARFLIINHYNLVNSPRTPVERSPLKISRVYSLPKPHEKEVEEDPDFISFNVAKIPKTQKTKSKLSLPFDFEEKTDYIEEDLLYPVVEESPIVEEQIPEPITSIPEPDTEVVEESPIEEVQIPEPIAPIPEPVTEEESTNPPIVETPKIEKRPKKIVLNAPKKHQITPEKSKTTSEYTVMVLSDDHPIVEKIFHSFKENIQDANVKIVHHLEPRQFLRAMRRRSDLLIVDDDTQGVNSKQLIEEIQNWGVKTPVMILSKSPNSETKNLKSMDIVKQVHPKTPKGIKKSIIFLLK